MINKKKQYIIQIIIYEQDIMIKVLRIIKLKGRHYKLYTSKDKLIKIKNKKIGCKNILLVNQTQINMFKDHFITHNIK